MKTKPLPPVKIIPDQEEEHAKLCAQITLLASATLPNWHKLKDAVDRRNQLIDTTQQ